MDGALEVHLPKGTEDDDMEQVTRCVEETRPRVMKKTPDAPQLGNGELSRALGTLGFGSNRLYPRVFDHRSKDVYIVAHVDDLLVTGPRLTCGT